MADEGWIKLYRSIRSNWLWENGNERYAKWWMDILLLVNHDPRKMMDKTNHLVTIDAGMTLTSERKLSAKWEVDRRTVHKFLDLLEKEKMISLKRMKNKYTTLKVNNYADYQQFNEKSAPRNTPRNAPQSTPRNVHEQELKEVPNVDFKKIIDYLNEQTGKSYKNVESNKKLIRARLHDGFTEHDFAIVISYKAKEWKGNAEMEKYLRPNTLFASTHFDDYLNEAKSHRTVSSQKSDTYQSLDQVQEQDAEYRRQVEERLSSND